MSSEAFENNVTENNHSSNSDSETKVFTPVFHVEENDVECPESDINIEDLVERFMDEIRQGKNPSVEEYAQQYPCLAEDIRDLFPTLIILEKGSQRQELSEYSQSVGIQGVAPQKLERLNNFVIRREIGRGGMGVVYEAYDETLDRTVALKVMKMFHGEEEQTRKRFDREAKMAGKLHHTNIVPVYGSYTVDNHYFYVMQMIEGVSLEKFIREHMKNAPAATKSTGPLTHKFFARLFSITKTEKNEESSQPQENDDDSSPNIRVGCESYVQSLRSLQPTKISSSISEGEDIKPCSEPFEMPECSEDNFIDASKVKVIHNKQTNDQKKKQGRRESKKREKGKWFSTSPKKVDDKGLLATTVIDINYYHKICEVGIQVARALEYAHRHHVIHRDIKPSNLIVDYDGVVWVTDFGLAKPTDETTLNLVGDLTRQDQHVGTLRYLSPESLEGDFSPLSDVYSLGLTLYELLTFSPAFQETNYTKLYKQVSESSVEPLRKRRCDIPQDLETIVLKAVDEKKNRYATAGELADDLQRFLDDRPIQARRLNFFEKTWRLCKRNKLVASLTTAVALLAIGTIGFLFFYANNKRCLLEENAIAKERAQQNLELALTAFSKIFDTLGEGLEPNCSFIDNTPHAPIDEIHISEKDAKALENLLTFYDRFAKNNEAEPQLIRKSAEAYAKIGSLRKLLGRAKDSDAFDQSLIFYQRSLDNTSNMRERETIIFAKADIIAMMLEDSKQDGQTEKALAYCDAALRELSELPSDSPNAPEIESHIAELRFNRASMKLEKLRKGDLASLSFFDAPSFTLPEPKEVEAIQEDFDYARERLARIGDNKTLYTAASARRFARFNTNYALWRASLGEYEEARIWLEKSSAYTQIYAKEFPNDSDAFLALIAHYIVKAVIDAEIKTTADVTLPGYDEMQEYENAKEGCLNTVDRLVVKFPNAPLFDIYQIIVYYFFAKREASFGRLDQAEALLIKSIEKRKEFVQHYPDYEDFQFFVPLHVGYFELLVKENRLSEAMEKLDYIDHAYEEMDKKRQEKNLPIDPKKTDMRVKIKERLLKMLEKAGVATQN